MQGSSTKVTGGGGFVYENHVVAYYLAALLAQTPIEPGLGELVCVAAQQQNAGWTGGLDDVVLTFQLGVGRPELALSVKSFDPFTSRAAPADFVEAAWRHILGLEPRELGTDDLVGLVVAAIRPNIRASLSKLCSTARATDATSLEESIETPGAWSEVARRLYTSFACPEHLVEEYPAEETRPWRLLRILRPICLDFEDAQSSAREVALIRCRGALESGETRGAQSLWASLLTISDELRPAGGSISREDLLSRLAKLYSLRERPDHSLDLTRLSQISLEERERVRDQIGSVHLERSEARKQVIDALAGSPTVTLIGSAGVGKSALAKSVAEALDGFDIVWLSADRFAARTLQEMATGLGLKYSLDELLIDYPSEKKLFIIDGLERASRDNRSTLSLLARHLIGASSNWRILLVARAEDWQWLEGFLAEVGLPPGSLQRVDLAEPTDDELEPVWTAHPRLRPLSFRPELRSLLLKPKVLDLMARNESRRPDVSKWVGESDLIDWFWREEVDRGEHGIDRGEALKRLAQRQADELEAETPLSAIDTTAFEELRRDEFVRVVDEKVSFAHDLYGDWARARLLRGYGPNLIAWISPRLASPAWHRATRIHALSLIEQSDIEAWRALLREATQEDPVLGDLVLEAAIFAADPAAILTLIWDDLSAAKGHLLRRFLNRFLLVTTLPNPQLVEFATKLSGVEIGPSEAASLGRVPFPLYWPPILRFLSSHREEVAQLALRQIADICDMWLRRGDARFPQRREAAELALSSAENLYAASRNHTVMMGGIDEAVYRAALAGGEELPEEVADLALRLVRRRDVADVPDHETDWGDEIKLPPPWPLGPSERITQGAEKTLLSPDGLVPLFRGAPSLARETLVATLIEPPRRRDFQGLHMPGEKLGLEERLDWHAPSWFRGPFIAILRESPDEGITAILQIVDFATERWKEASGEDAFVAVQLASGERRFAGDGGIFGWYRDAGNAPNAVAVALMALERFLYERIDAGEQIDGLFERLLGEGSSASILGVLVAVACYQPRLIEGPLQPLIFVPELLVWDRYQKWMEQLSGQMAFTLGLINDSEELRKIALEWNEMPHRKRSLLEGVAIPLMLGRSHDEVFDRLLSKLQADHGRLRALGPGFERLPTIFDRDKYITVRGTDGKTYMTIPLTEEQEAEIRESGEQANKTISRLDFVPRCRRLLDGEISLDSEDLPGFWDALREHETAEPLDEFEPEFLSNEDALCGGIAVLLTQHRDWLAADPSREDWCKETLLRIIRNPPPRHFMTDEPHDDGLWAWDRFAAQAEATLLRERPSSEDLRLAAAHFACFYRYATVRTFFFALSKSRKELGTTFLDLRNLGLWWATQRPKIDRGQESEATVDRLNELAADFARGASPPEVEWDELVKIPETERVGHRRRHRRVRPVADVTQIESVSWWIPELDKAYDKTERAEWIAFWRRMLKFELGILDVAGIAGRDDAEVEGYPYSFDRWLLSQLAGVSLDMHDSEDPGLVWRPILDLGIAAEAWVQPFLNAWLTIGFGQNPTPAHFVPRWREMIEYALGSPRWPLDDWRYRGSGLWHTLLALGAEHSPIWEGDRSSVVLELRDLYERWASRGLRNEWGAHRFARFLWRTEAGQALQLDGLVWLDRTASEGLWTEGDVQDELARLLDAIWSSKPDKLGSSSEAGQAFRHLLRLLAEAQNAVALVLVERVGGL